MRKQLRRGGGGGGGDSFYNLIRIHEKTVAADSFGARMWYYSPVGMKCFELNMSVLTVI
jgi:hypothetical protein